MCVGQRLTAVPSAERDPHGSEMGQEVLVVISQLDLGLHSNTFDFMNHSTGNVQVIKLVTFLREVSKKHKKQVENALKLAVQEGTKKAK